MSFKTLLRIGVGAGFMAHGAQKLFGWFGGHGLEGTGQFFESSLRMAPGKRNAAAAGASEFGGGAVLASGLATPIATTALTSTMLTTTAIWKVHKDKGFFAQDGGWELNALLIAAVLAIAEEESGPLAAVFTLVAGAAGSYAAIEVGRREYEKLQTAAPAAGANNGAPDQEPAGDPASAPA